MAGKTTPPEQRPDGAGIRVAIAVARFNLDITEALLDGALRCAKACGAPEPDVVWVPGAFELPLAARALADGGRYDALVALGCVIRGETTHYDLVAGEASRGLMDVQLDTGIPIGFGLVTTEDHAQALARAGGEQGNKGYDATMAALEMALTLRGLR